MGCVYVVTNKLNGKQYVGMTKFTAEIRWKEHIKNAIKLGHKTKFAKAIRKYGPKQFGIQAIYKSDNIKELFAEEKRMIDLLGTMVSGYNSTKGGEGVVGGHLSEEHKEKLRRKRKPLTKEHRQTLSQKLKGRVVSQETRKALSRALKGKSRSEAQKQAMREAKQKTDTHEVAKSNWRKRKERYGPSGNKPKELSAALRDIIFSDCRGDI